MQKLVQFKHKLYGFLVYLDPPVPPYYRHRKLYGIYGKSVQ